MMAVRKNQTGLGVNLTETRARLLAESALVCGPPKGAVDNRYGTYHHGADGSTHWKAQPGCKACGVLHCLGLLDRYELNGRDAQALAAEFADKRAALGKLSRQVDRTLPASGLVMQELRENEAELDQYRWLFEHDPVALRIFERQSGRRPQLLLNQLGAVLRTAGYTQGRISELIVDDHGGASETRSARRVQRSLKLVEGEKGGDKT